MAQENDGQKLERLLKESREWNRYHHPDLDEQQRECNRQIEINQLREKIYQKTN